MRLPGIVPRLLFGVGMSPSRSFAQIQSIYQEALSNGAQAGNYAPRRLEYPEYPKGVRQKIMLEWNRVWGQLIRATHGWDDRSLDRLRLPHPLIGKLSMREMLYFTLYHHRHHWEIVAGRANAASTWVGDSH
jgi:hypothetical protein